MRALDLRIAAASRSHLQPKQQGFIDALASGHSRPPPKTRRFCFAAAEARALLVGKPLPAAVESRLEEVPPRMSHCPTTIVAA
jgi:hypothetical protein